MALKYNWGICVNNDKDDSGNPCPLCASKEKQKVVVNREFVCAECGEPLKKVAPPKTPLEKYKVEILSGIAALAIVGGGTAYYLTSSGEEPVQPITHLEIADYDPMLWVGTTDTLTVMPTPADAKATYIWSSSDESVATVMNGIVKAVGEGETTITVKVKGNEDISASATFYAETYEEAPVNEPKEKGKETQKPVSTPASDELDLGFATYQGDIKNGKPEGNGTMTFKSRHIIPGSKGDVVAEPGEYVVGTWRNGEVNLVTLHQKNGNKPIVTHK